ncbi:hypothetical protein [Agrobacterium tumefaciens]|uniref:hypothetical protein n=1 Tax=Agrobacterium tumefaciens TaxID=358 RepID=UPI000DD8CE58|nr:hypothetical protein [Agrobacterium tumefaciens]
MTEKIKFDWETTLSGGAQCEVAIGSKCLSIGVEPLRDSPWEEAVWMLHAPTSSTDVRRVAVDIAMTIDEGRMAAEEAARAWLRTAPELRVVE